MSRPPRHETKTPEMVFFDSRPGNAFQIPLSLQLCERNTPHQTFFSLD